MASIEEIITVAKQTFCGVDLKGDFCLKTNSLNKVNGLGSHFHFFSTYTRKTYSVPFSLPVPTAAAELKSATYK